MVADHALLQLIENLPSFEISPPFQGEFQDGSDYREGMVNKVVNLIGYGYTVKDSQMGSGDPELKYVKIGFFLARST
jgi:hypothetical protein